MRSQPYATVTSVVIAGLVLSGCGAADDGVRTHLTASAASTSAGAGRIASAGTTAHPGASSDSMVTVAAARALLDRYGTALAGRDSAAYRRTLADPSSEFGRQRLAAYELFGSLPVTGLRWSAVTVTEAQPENTPGDVSEDSSGHATDPATDGVVRATGHYTLAGYDAGPHTFTLAYRVTRAADGWRLAGEARDNRPQVWDLSGGDVLRSRRVLIVGSLPRPQLADVQRRAECAIDAVGRVWTAPWRQRLVVLAPASSSQAGELLGLAASDLDGVAAVTDGALPAGRTAPADRVVLDPTGFAALTPAGQQVVLTHEATHVAVRSGTIGSVPLWLSEGLAEVVAYDGVDLPEATVAETAVAQARADGLPTRLPADSAFAVGGSSLAVRYQESWLAVGRLRALLGPAALTALYRRAADPAAGPDPQSRVARALAAGSPALSLAQLTTQWRQKLARLASG